MRQCEAEAPAQLDIGGWVVIGMLIRCGQPAAALWQGKCECGHSKEAWLCAAHGAEVPGSQVGCFACLTGERPHDCPMRMAAIRQPEMN